MHNFTPLESTIGGALIGLSSFMVLFFQARVAGVSGIVGSLFSPTKGDVGWRLAFVTGMVGMGAALGAAWPSLFGDAQRARPELAVAGLLVGLGTRLANGCTSGHGVCGLSRLSSRSIVATFVFMGTAASAVLVRGVITGGAP